MTTTSDVVRKIDYSSLSFRLLVGFFCRCHLYNTCNVVQMYSYIVIQSADTFVSTGEACTHHLKITDQSYFLKFYHLLFELVICYLMAASQHHRASYRVTERKNQGQTRRQRVIT